MLSQEFGCLPDAVLWSHLPYSTDKVFEVGLDQLDQLNDSPLRAVTRVKQQLLRGCKKIVVELLAST